MIVELKDTTTSKIGKKLQDLRETGGVVALGRVLSLIVETDAAHLEQAVSNANGASKLHPSRIIVIAKEPGANADRLDAEIRVGGDAGASEVIILRSSGSVLSNIESLVNGLLLPDAPVVAWWPGECVSNPAGTEIGKIANRRITDASQQSNPVDFLRNLAQHYTPGDGDTAWTRITLWRSQLAALLDSHLDRKIESVILLAKNSSPSAHLLGKWLGLRLGVKVSISSENTKPDSSQAIDGVILNFNEGALELHRVKELATITQPGSPTSTVLLPQRSDLDCLVEDLRYLGEDATYAEVLKEFRN